MKHVLVAMAAIPLVAGCGNQMMRQPSYRPLDAPRAAPPADSVPYTAAAVEWDSAPTHTAAFGNNVIDGSGASFAISDPSLPPPDLSDNASNDPAPAEVNTLKDPLVRSTYVVHSGRTIFLNRCVQCHSPTGYGFGPVGGYLSPPPTNLAQASVQKRSDGALFWQISMGTGKMPGFAHWTTPEQRWALVQYVHSLKEAEPGNNVNTRQASYPVYGSPGFEDGFQTNPFKVLGHNE